MITAVPPARNRVTPYGDIVAVTGRGAWMGNRGRLHEGSSTRDVVRDYQTKAWLTCALSFKDRRLPQWEARHNTQLFFLDEAVALAAGHRPCAECRRPAYNAYRAAWSATHDGAGVRARDLDEVLHRQRRPAGPGSHGQHPMAWRDLPDGVFVIDEAGPSVIIGAHLAGYDAETNAYIRWASRPRGGTAQVITPLANVEILRAGYPVQVDAAATGEPPTRS
jgi:hypothetical protein